MASISNDLRSVANALCLLAPHIHPDQRPLVRLARQNLASLAEQVECLENICPCKPWAGCPPQGSTGGAAEAMAFFAKIGCGRVCFRDKNPNAQGEEHAKLQ